MAAYFAFFLLAILPGIWTKLPEDFIKKTPKEKQDILWEKINKDPYDPDRLPNDYRTGHDLYSSNDSRVVDPEFLKNVFLHFSDEMEESHPKLVFPMGVVVKAEYVAFPSSPYSGIFKSGGIGFLRFGSFLTPGALLTTTCATKILIDGGNSQSLLTEHRTRGRNGTAEPYFAEDLFTGYDVDIDSPGDRVMGDAFTNTTFLLGGDDPLDHPINNANLGLVEQSRIESNGKNATTVVAPYRVRYVPANITNPIVNTLTQDFRTVLLKELPADVKLFNVEAQSEPGCDDWLPIGEVYSRSKPVASYYADQKLFFRQARRQWDKASGLQSACEHMGTTGTFDLHADGPAPQIQMPAPAVAPPANDTVHAN